MKKNWSIREYTQGDEEGILALHNRIYGEVPDESQWLEEWRWRHNNNPSGIALIWVAVDADKIIGSDVWLPVKLKIGRQTILGSQNVGLMMHPCYRHQGIYLTLAHEAFRKLEQNGLLITYGFPVALSGHLKTGYTHIGSLQTMINPVNLENIVVKYIHNKLLTKIFATIGNSAINLFYRTKKSPTVDGLTTSRISSFDDCTNDFWNNIKNDYAIIVVRDKEYLNWRYINVPGAEYAIYAAKMHGRIMGYIVLSCRRERGLKFGHIVDIIIGSDGEDIACNLISKAVEYFRQEKVDLIINRMIGPKIFRTVLKNNGFIFSYFLSRRSRFIARVNTHKVSESLLRDRRNWFIQMGDSDII